EFLYAMLKRDGRIRHPKLDYEIYVKRVQGRNLIDPVIKHKNPQTGLPDGVATARDADLRIDLANAQLLIHMRDGEATGTQVQGYFSDRIFEVPLSKELINQRIRKAREMSWQELAKQLEVLHQQENEIEARIALAAAKQGVNRVPPDLAQHL